MSGRPRVVVTRKLPAAVEEQLTREFEAQLNGDDHPFSAAELQNALRTAARLAGEARRPRAVPVLSGRG